MDNSNVKILVVDDIAENRDLLLRRLQRLGIVHIDQAENGLQAISAIDSKSYDLVLLDIMMPEMDGFEVLDALRADGRINDLPIIVISAMNEIDAVVRCIERGAEDFLFKPFNPVLLRARVLASLEKKLLRDRTRDELKRKQAELNEARTLQLALVPPPLHEMCGEHALALDVYLEPAKEVGGDLVDHFRIGDGLVAFLIGDVSDKGAGAALMMARTHALFRGLATRPDAQEIFSDPSKAMNIVNVALAAGNSGCMFVTFFLGVLDLSTLRLSYVRAGHVPPFHWNGTAKVNRLEGAGGPPLGLVEDLLYEQHAIVLSPNENLLVVTDGFTEANNAAGHMFGDARISEFLAGANQVDAATLPSLVRMVHEFEAGGAQADDMAAILLSFRPMIGGLKQFEAKVRPRPPEISDLTERSSTFLEHAGVDMRTTHHVAMILEELLTNLATHGGTADEPASIRISVEPASVQVEVKDSGPEFDPRSAPDPELSASVEDRKIGGLGLFLLRKIASDLYYRRDGVHNYTAFSVRRS